MERKSIYVDGDCGTEAGAESPRSITRGGLGAGAETPTSIIGGGSGGRQVAESRGVMQELILLGRNNGAHLEDLAWIGEFQGRRSVVRDGCMLRGRSSGSPLPVAMTGFCGSNPPSAVDTSKHQGTKCTLELRGEVSEFTASGVVTPKPKQIPNSALN